MKFPNIVGSIVAAVIAVSIWGCGGSGGNPAAPEDQNVETPEPLAWTSTQRLPVSEFLASVDGFGSTHLAVGSGGVILARNGSGSWDLVRRNVGESLRRITMVDEKIALVVGTEGILRSADAGRTWKQVLASDARLGDVSAFGKTAIAVGDDVIFISSDFGETWKLASSFPSSFYGLVSVHSTTTAMVAGTGPKLLRSTDGGDTWVEVAVAELPSMPRDLEFFTEDLGVAAIGGGRVFFTSNGGDTWDEVADFGFNNINHIDVIDADTGHAILINGQRFVTENGGKTWSFNGVVPLEDANTEAIDASDDNAWCVVGGLGFITESPDAGSTWNQVSEGRVGEFFDVAFANEIEGIAAFQGEIDPAEAALRTTDGGATWFAVDPDIKRPEFVVFSGDLGLMVGREEVALSTNAGASWRDVSPGGLDALRAAAILDNSIYVVCGHNNAVFRTTDGAASWDAVSVPTTATTRHLAADFFPGTDAGIILSENTGLRTTDSGATWLPVNVQGRGLACVSADVAIAVGPEILRTSDRGETWNVVTIPDEKLNRVAFSGSLHGVAVGVDGYMVETLDGGLTWDKVERITSLPLAAVAFRAPGLAVAVGQAGVVLAGSSQ